MTGEISRAISSTAYQTYEKRILKEVMTRPVPHHVAVIMDGNRRYARSSGCSCQRGTRRASRSSRRCSSGASRSASGCSRSTRSRRRTSGARARRSMTSCRMFVSNFRRLGDDERVHRNRISVRVLGQTDLLARGPEGVHKVRRGADQGLRLVLRSTSRSDTAGREEIVQAIKRIAEDRQGRASSTRPTITEQTFADYPLHRRTCPTRT